MKGVVAFAETAWKTGRIAGMALRVLIRREIACSPRVAIATRRRSYVGNPTCAEGWKRDNVRSNAASDRQAWLGETSKRL